MNIGRRHLMITGTSLSGALAAILTSGSLNTASASGADGRVPVATNGAPLTIPALTTWNADAESSFTFSEGLRIYAYCEELDHEAQRAADDLTEMLSHPITVEKSKGFRNGKGHGKDKGKNPGKGKGPKPRPGSLTLHLDDSRDDLGDEGYEIVVGESIDITAATIVGVFYGTRSVAQWAAQAGLGGSVPGGSCIDRPEYPERGLGHCVCSSRNSLEALQREIILMSYLKYNWFMPTIRVYEDVSSEPWPGYSVEEARSLKELAHDLHMTVVVMASAHASSDPAFQLPKKDGTPSGRIDVSIPGAAEHSAETARRTVELWGGGVGLHMGGDEYLLYLGGYSAWPHLDAWAKEQAGPAATTRDALVIHYNKVAELLHADGFTDLRMWNDNLPASNQAVTLDPSYIIHHWTNNIGGSSETNRTVANLLRDGHRVVNATYNSYLIRANDATGFPQNKYDKNVSNLSFYGENIEDLPQELLDNVLGMHVNMWPDNITKRTELDQEQRLRALAPVVALRNWSGTSIPLPTYAEFTDLVASIGYGPGSNNVVRQPLEPGRYVIGLGDQYLSSAAGGTTVLGDAPEAWNLEATSDDYYRITSDAGRALTIAVQGPITAGAPQSPGVPATLVAATGSAQEHWWLDEQDDGTFTITHANHQQLLVREGQELHQHPELYREPSRFTVTAEGAA